MGVWPHFWVDNGRSFGGLHALIFGVCISALHLGNQPSSLCLQCDHSHPILWRCIDLKPNLFAWFCETEFVCMVLQYFPAVIQSAWCWSGVTEINQHCVPTCIPVCAWFKGSPFPRMLINLLICIDFPPCDLKPSQSAGCVIWKPKLFVLFASIVKLISNSFVGACIPEPTAVSSLCAGILAQWFFAEPVLNSCKLCESIQLARFSLFCRLSVLRSF